MVRQAIFLIRGTVLNIIEDEELFPMRNLEGFDLLPGDKAFLVEVLDARGREGGNGHGN